jgi:hypothetical protein
MISIEEVHNKILKILKKNYGSFITPSGIDEAVNSASIDLFNQECIRYKDSQTLPDILKRFKQRAQYTATAGIATTTSLDAEIISVLAIVGAKTFPTRIVQSETEWISRSMADLEIDQKTGEPLNFYIKELVITQQDQEIPQDFISACYAYLKETATSKKYDILLKNSKEFDSRNMAQLVEDPNKPEEPFQLNKKEHIITTGIATIRDSGSSLPANFIKEIDVEVDGFKASIVSEEMFNSKDMTEVMRSGNGEIPSDPLHLNRKSLDIAVTAQILTDGVALPGSFVKELAIYADGYEGMIVREDQFFSKNIEDVTNPEGTDTAIHLNRASESFAADTVTAGVELSVNFVKAEAVSVVFEDGNSYEGILVSPEEFYTKQLEDLIGDSNKGEDISHLFKSQKEYPLTAASERFLELPGDYVRWTNIFYKDAQNNFKEGEILSDHEFSERIESKLMTPTSSDPIARIINNKIEFYPKPTGIGSITYVLTYMAFPVIYRPLFKIEDNKLICRPALPATAVVILSEIQHPVRRRPVAKINNNKIFLNWGGGSPPTTLTLTYIAHPVAKRAVAKIVDDKIYVNYGDDNAPTSIKLTYLAHPVVKRPVLRVRDNRIEIDPINTTDFTYVLGHYKHPVDERALVRVFQDASATKVEIRPATVVSVIVNSLEKPTKAVYGYTQTNGVITYNELASTDLNWDYKAVTSIVDRALFYLGHPMRDPATIALERTKEEADKSQKSQQ